MKMNISVRFVVMFGIDMLNSMYQYAISDTAYFRGIDRGSQDTAFMAVEDFCHCLHIDKETYIATIKAIKRHESKTGKIAFPNDIDAIDVFLKALK